MRRNIKALENELREKKIISGDLSKVLAALRSNSESRLRKNESEDLDDLLKNI
jgi:hypothetical protein